MGRWVRVENGWTRSNGGNGFDFISDETLGFLRGGLPGLPPSGQNFPSHATIGVDSVNSHEAPRNLDPADDPDDLRSNEAYLSEL